MVLKNVTQYVDVDIFCAYDEVCGILSTEGQHRISTDGRPLFVLIGTLKANYSSMYKMNFSSIDVELAQVNVADSGGRASEFAVN